MGGKITLSYKWFKWMGLGRCAFLIDIIFLIIISIRLILITYCNSTWAVCHFLDELSHYQV